MNKQTCELLSILLESANRRLSYSELASQMGVSTRMLRNYLHMIEQFLDQAQLPPLETFPTGEITFSGTRRQASAIRQAMFTVGFYSYKLSNEERVQFILLELLRRTEAITLTELSSMLYVSRGTLLKDLELVEEALGDMGLALSPSKARGYRLDAGEEQRRDCLLRCIEGLTDPNLPLLQVGHIFDHFIIEAFQLETLVPAVESAIKQSEEHFGVSWPDGGYHGLVRCASIVLHRITSNHLVGALSFDTRQLQGSPCLDLACYLFSLLAEQLPIQVTDEEQYYLAQCLDRFGICDRQIEDSEEHLHLSILTKSFLFAVSQQIGIDIVHDPMLQSFLSNHVRGMLRREQRGGKDIQPYKDELKAQYPLFYRAVVDHISIFQQGLDLHYDDDQITFLLLHVVAAVERYHRMRGAPRVILVCNSGMSTANFLAERLKRYFRLQVASTVSAHRLEDILGTVPHDLIISTVPLKECARDYIQISPILTQEDMSVVQRALSEVNDAWRGCPESQPPPGAGAGCADVLPPGRILLDARVKDWREAIRVAGALLRDLGETNEDYICEMIRAVEENGPYIVYVPGVALAHAVSPPDFAGFRAALVRLAVPVPFGHAQNDPVSYVVAIQISDVQKYVDTLIALMDMMCERTVRDELDRAATPQALCQAVARYDDRTPEGERS